MEGDVGARRSPLAPYGGNNRTSYSRQLTARWSTATGVLMSTSSIRRRLLHRGLRRVSLYRIPSLKTINGCVCNELMSTEPDKLISTKLFFQMSHSLICATMMAAFLLDAMLMNATFQIALSNGIVTQHPELWFGMRFRIMDDTICYELRVISIAIDTFVKSYGPKPFHSFKASLELPFSRIMHAHMLQILQDFCLAKHMQLLLWSPAYSPDMTPFEHVWDLVGWRLAHYPCPAASKDELFLRIQSI
ncbi:transposable element Tcb2 transposase [Trichonephila clavipes]|nr:transposable element Tcb2 transposase [Trichonephila clavipes]